MRGRGCGWMEWVWERKARGTIPSGPRLRLFTLRAFIRGPASATYEQLSYGWTGGHVDESLCTSIRAGSCGSVTLRRLASSQNLLDPLHFAVIPSALDLLVRPRPNPNVGLASAPRCLDRRGAKTYSYTRGAHGVNGSMTLPNDPHHIFPWPLEVGAIAVHLVLETAFLQHSLTLCYLGTD